MDPDRNLLFAVLALQADFLTQDQFVRACTLWTTRKETPLAELLVEQGWLTPDDRADLDRLLQRKVKKHGGDVHASLAAVADEEVRDLVGSLNDADLNHSLASPAVPKTRGDAVEQDVPSAAFRSLANGVAGRNLLYEELGHGAIKRVLRGRDPELGRELAVAVLLDRHGDDESARLRFVEEAQIGGQLQHPGVVPVYELGQFPDRRPFFTMKLVKGRTLHDLLKERKDLRQDQARFLSIFEQVCQALAYAHARGVIHRDLKPGNIMIGAFGEVQVMDWGLAKVLDRKKHEAASADAPTDGPTLIRTTRSGSKADDGRTGVVGTPAYMPPEQARGEVTVVDERADVFGLGAILCVILTGKPPYVAADKNIMHQKAVDVDLADAWERLSRCQADPEVVQLCQECLAPEREARPRDAKAVALRIAAHQAAVQERLREVELERAAAEARAVEERKRQRVTVALAASVLLLVVTGGSGGWWVQQQRATALAKQQEINQRTRLTMDQAQTLQDEGWRTNNAAQLAEAKAAAERATELARSGASADLARAADELAAAIQAKVEQAEKNRVLLTRLLEVRQPRETKRYQRDESSGMMVALAEPTVEEQFANAFRRWGLDLDQTPAETILRCLREQPEAVLQQISAGLDEWSLDRRQRKVKDADWRKLNDLADNLDGNERRRDLRRQRGSGRLAQDRRLTILTHALLPWSALSHPLLGEHANRVRELATQVNPATEPLLGIQALVHALRLSGDEAQAIAVLQAALVAHPNSPLLLNALSQLLTEQKPPRWGETIECYRAARALQPDLGIALGKALGESGRIQEGVALLTAITQRQPDNPEMYFYLGNALQNQKQLPAAVAAYQKAIELKPDYAESHNNLGIALHDQKQLPAAVAALHKAIALQPNYAKAYNNLGTVLYDQEHLPEAEAALRKAVTLQPDYAEAFYNLGIVLYAQKQLPEAVVAYHKAIELTPDFAFAYSNLGAALADQKRLPESVLACRKAIALQPDFTLAYINLGNALYDQNNLAEAEAAYRKALALKPDYALAYNNLGNALSAQKQLPEAEAAYRKAIALQPDDALAYYNLGIVLNAQKHLPEAVAAYHKAIKLKPDDALAYNNLGNAQKDQNNLAEAVAAFRKADRLLPNDPLIRSNLQRTERWLELDSQFSEVLSGQAILTKPQDRLDMALFCSQYKHQNHVAVHFFWDAFAADPQLADDFKTHPRYYAACSALRAAYGQGEDAKNLPEKVLISLRQQALAWLRAHLAVNAQLAVNPAELQGIRQRLTHWQQDADLAGVRDAAALARLPAAERAAWQALWQDVAALLRKVEAKP